MAIANQATSKLPVYFEAVLKQNWRLANRLADDITRLEQEADEIKRQIRSNFSRSLFMPVSRSDLLDLLKSQDRIPNRVRDVVGLCSGRKMTLPSELGSELLNLVETCVKASATALQTLNTLEKMFETGFSEAHEISELITELSAIEHQADLQQKHVQSRLYKTEQTLNPVDVMFLYRLIDWIGDIADNAEAVGNRIL